MESPFFSIVIPIYKAEKYLSQCIDSVLNQSYKDIEIILVDDGSPDNCPNICDEYGLKDARIKVIHKQNGGLSSARNAGIESSAGKYITFIDSDDFYVNNSFFSRAKEKIDETNAECVLFKRAKYYDLTDTILSSDSLYENDTLGIKNYSDLIYDLSKKDELEASACMKIIKSEILKRNGLYFKQGLLSEDVEWAFRLYPILKSAAIINCVNYAYRIRGGSITHTIGKKNIDDLFYSVEEYADKILDSKLDLNLKRGLLNYVAYQYFISIALVFAKLSRVDRREYINKLREYKWLCDYAISKKTKKSSFIVKLFGIRGAMLVLGKYLKNKK